MTGRSAPSDETKTTHITWTQTQHQAKPSRSLHIWGMLSTYISKPSTSCLCYFIFKVDRIFRHASGNVWACLTAWRFSGVYLAWHDSISHTEVSRNYFPPSDKWQRSSAGAERWAGTGIDSRVQGGEWGLGKGADQLVILFFLKGVRPGWSWGGNEDGMAVPSWPPLVTLAFLQWCFFLSSCIRFLWLL